MCVCVRNKIGDEKLCFFLKKEAFSLVRCKVLLVSSSTLLLSVHLLELQGKLFLSKRSEVKINRDYGFFETNDPISPYHVYIYINIKVDFPIKTEKIYISTYIFIVFINNLIAKKTRCRQVAQTKNVTAQLLSYLLLSTDRRTTIFTHFFPLTSLHNMKFTYTSSFQY